jgi:hypothetical protein
MVRALGVGALSLKFDATRGVTIFDATDNNSGNIFQCMKSEESMAGGILIRRERVTNWRELILRSEKMKF